MSLTFDGNGVQTNTFSELRALLEAGYREIYGTDIVTDQESPDGQRINLETLLRFDIESAFSWLYSNLDPDLNTGDMQQIIGKLSGLVLLPASRSQWDVTVNMSRAKTLPSGYTITDENNQNWFLDSDVDVLIGDNEVTFLSSLWGSIAGVSGSSFTQATPEIGVVSISASVDAVQGREEETPEQFRLRRQRSTENPAQSTIGAIYAKLAQVNGVTDLQVYDNSSDTPNQITGSSNPDILNGSEPVTIGAHTMWVVIEGGSLDDIGEIVAKHRLGNTKGSVQVSYIDTLTKPNGDDFQIVNLHNIDRPVLGDLYVRLTATQKVSGSPIDTDAIKNKLSLVDFEIGQYVDADALYQQSLITSSNYNVTDLEVSLNGIDWTDGRVFSGYDGKLSISTSNVTITTVPV